MIFTNRHHLIAVFERAVPGPYPFSRLGCDSVVMVDHFLRMSVSS
jgi:uncharacterized membrane protein